MIKLKKITFLILALVVIAVYGCMNQSPVSFKDGIKRISQIDSKYGASIRSPPNESNKIDGFISELAAFKSSNKISEPLKSILNFKMKFLEAEKLNAEGWQWDRASTTEYGFGCKKGYQIVTQSAMLRNSSAQKGYEAVAILQKFVDDYPDEAKSLNLTQKDVIVLNAIYYKIEEQAKRDSTIIHGMCRQEQNVSA